MSITRVAIYARVSTHDQAEKALSVPEQVRSIQAFCKKQGWPVVAVYKDEGKSGATVKGRPQFSAMMQAGLSKKPPFDLILTRDSARFGRGDEDPGLRAKLRRNGVRVDNLESPSGDMNDALTPQAKQMERFQWMMDSGQREAIAAKVIPSQRAAVRDRGFTGSIGTCYGYRSVYRLNAKNKRSRTVEVDPVAGPIVRTLFEKYRDGESLHSLVKWLRANRVAPGPRAKDWYESTIRRLFQNRTVLGHGIYGRLTTFKHPESEKTHARRSSSETTVYEGAFPALVDEEVFNAVNDRLLRNERNRPNGGNPANLLRGVGVCKSCGWVLSFQKRHATWYYLCQRLKQKGKAHCSPACSGALQQKAVDTVVYRALTLFLGIPQFEAVLRSAVRAFNARGSSYDGTSHVDQLEARIRKTEADLARAVDLTIHEPDLADVYVEKIRGLKADGALLREQRDKVKASLSRLGTLDEDEFVKAARTMRKALREKDVARVKALLPLLVARVEVDLTKRKGTLIRREGVALSWSGSLLPETFKYPPDVREMLRKQGHHDVAVRFIARYDLTRVDEMAREVLEQIGGALSA